MKEILIHKCIDLQFQTVKQYFFYPIVIICFYLALIKYYFHGEIKNIFASLIALSFMFSFFIYYKQSQKHLPAYISHKTFFLKKGANTLLIASTFYIFIAFILFFLALLIEKCAIPFAPIKNQKSLEFTYFFALLLLFTLPSQCLLIAFTRKSEDTYVWLLNAIFTMLCIFFLYIEWCSPILKPELKKYHYAFFNDIVYYFDIPSCLILEQNKIKLEYLDKKLCTVKEKFETTSAIGRELILTFKNNQRIVIPKPHYYSQLLVAYNKN
ncbi:hypothetical protein [Legionella clemsonensis]|nr:hypothetical protein [Legionella clemsonensis]